MIGAGRPLRFLLLVIGGWTGARLWCCWPALPTLPALIRTVVPLDRLAGVPVPRPEPRSTTGVIAPIHARETLAALRQTPPSPKSAETKSRPPPLRTGLVALAEASQLRFGDPVLAALPAARDPTRFGMPTRLSGSAWLLARGGPALASGLAGAQLGGSQAGLRLAYAVDHARRLAIAGRLSTAIGGSAGTGVLSDREGAIGLAWRPTRLPVTLMAEQRFVFERGGHGGPTIGVIAGLPPTPIAAGFRLEAYGQAGAIARSGAGNTVEGFGDGAARLTRPVMLGPIRLDVGAGTWGGAQRGAARLDVGPTVGVSLPVARHALRLTADWRERIAGDAAPGSGPALSLGTDF